MLHQKFYWRIINKRAIHKIGFFQLLDMETRIEVTRKRKTCTKLMKTTTFHTQKMEI